MTNTLEKIVAERKKRIASEGHTTLSLPKERDLPVQPFLRTPALICEIKSRSPSRGIINNEIDPLEQAAHYVEQGIQSISVLTEEKYFSGNLSTLRRIKQKFPTLSILRKDFLLDREDLRVSWLAGADAVLLIASLHSSQELASLYHYAHEIGMAVLTEVHSEEDIDKIRPFSPNIVGINCRDLRNFQIDRLHPLILRPSINWSAKLVYESGITTVEDADFAYDAGFDALLCGEAVMRKKSFAAALQRSAKGIRIERIQHPSMYFWQYIANKIRLQRKNKEQGVYRPLVKVCGICSQEDAWEVEEAGADLLGFVLATSPRRVNPTLLRSLKDTALPRVGVVTGTEEELIDKEVANLLEEGYLDAIQFHGCEVASSCKRVVPYYKAVHPRSTDETFDEFHAPRILIDTWDKTLAGGTGKPVQSKIVDAWKLPLWLAGGLRSDNVRACLQRWNPELIDVSSGLEERPGKKNRVRIQRFFQEVNNINTL